MKLLNLDKINELQRKPKQIRNICIIAHVDHGKTTLADSLLASNGIISQKMAGKLRYMDSRKDEQERGITMKSSSIALLYKIGIEEYFINLIDSPGHVDFSSEVSTAIRLCDGAIVVVDVVEGVCPQTQGALKQAWLENITPVLVLNKIDRLILEKQMSPLDAYIHLTQVLEQVNAVMAQLFTTEVFGRSSLQSTSNSAVSGLYDWSTGLEDADDSKLYFSPEQGNVVFASAVDGWGFGIQDFAGLYSKKLGIEESKLIHCLWGDYYIHGKTKEIMSGAQLKAKKPLFVQFVLDNIWALYETVIMRKDKDRLQKISESLQVHLTVRDLRQTDPKIQLQSFFSQWLPLANAVLDMVCTKLPPPSQITEEKAEKLMCSQLDRFDSLPNETQALKSAFLSCASDENAPVIVYISKMFPVDRKSLPQNQAQPLSSEEIAKRRDEARQRHAQRTAIDADSVQELSEAEIETKVLIDSKIVEVKEENADIFLAFARVFSGTLCSGQDLYVLGPKHDPRTAIEELQSGIEIDPILTLKDLRSDQHITKVNIQQLYLLMGRDLQQIDKVPAGNVIGIAGLEEHVLKSATLSSTVACPAFTELQLSAAPILRVAVEPKQPLDIPALVHGLKLLNQADACVQVMVQETGEHVLVTAGEIHLERCLNDLQERYAKIEINASEPIVPFRETIVDPPIVDMVNELILDHANKKETQSDETLITITTANKQSVIKLRAHPLPASVTSLLENNVDLLRAMDQGLALGTLSDRTLSAVTSLKTKLEESWGVENVKNIWSLGPRRCGPNVLLNNISDYKCPSIWSPLTDDLDPRSEYDSSFINGFQMASLGGPLCEEPMMGVCFVVEEWNLSLTNSSETGQPFGPVSGQIMSVVKEGCRRAFQAQPQRLMAAMYCCSIQVNAEVLGRMYAVLGRRHGRVLHGDMTEGSASFSVTAVLPVVESFNFAAEMRKQTSGLATPQLFFSHWEVIDMDPFWRPSTEEEYTHFGEKADSGNRARAYVDAVRRRKGLAVQEKIVQFAEKQRTLHKKK